ncbi:uncharacterized protein LOC123543061 [Mercenaria mercenaria]|uniref:uncharacterized protein LOC123543061 n=1 Tax=Mercenaria mercenaria TaxID=6596 RepID=UPI00234EF3E4|nr:uncharacterized protein LOC123543061 [Mercenaria mercenaria]
MNTKLATALVHSGTGVTQLNSILGCLNIPNVTHSLAGRRLKESGKAIEEVALESLQEALEEEKDSDGEVEVSVDGGWQKRGCGRAYDSLSGHCTMIGCKTGKVVGYAVRSKGCRICEASEVKGQCPG